MRIDISVDRLGWLYRLGYKKLIVVVFLLRVIAASAYDIYVVVTDRDIMLPDSRFYSIRGRYVNLVLEGYDNESITKDLLPCDRASQEMFVNAFQQDKGRVPSDRSEGSIYAVVIGVLYFIFGYSTIWVRIFNICVSMMSVYLLFEVARRSFGVITANLFLLFALFLPTQFAYSITLSRDILRIFVVALAIWFVYGIKEVVWKRRLKLHF